MRDSTAGHWVRGRNWGLVNSTQLTPLTQKPPLKIDDLLKNKLRSGMFPKKGALPASLWT